MFLGLDTATLVGIVSIIFIALVIFLIAFLAQRYKRCPSNKVLVVFGKGVGTGTAKTIHGGAALAVAQPQAHGLTLLQRLTGRQQLSARLVEHQRIAAPQNGTRVQTLQAGTQLGESIG